MSKRARPTTHEEHPEIPPEIWFLIGEYIQWYEVEALLKFIALSRSAIRFVQKTLRVLVHNLLRPNTGYQHPLVTAVCEQRDNRVTKALDKCLLLYYSAASGTLRQWREWSATLLSIVNLSRMRHKYCDYIVEGLPRPSTSLCNVYYCAKGEKAKRLDMIRATHVVVGMTSKDYMMRIEAVASVKMTRPASEQEMHLSVLEAIAHGDQWLRAACYYAQSNVLKMRVPVERDTFENVVLMNPRCFDDYLHIYSKHSEYVTNFRRCCMTFTGPSEDAIQALYLHANVKAHDLRCIKQCKAVSKRIKGCVTTK